MKCEVLPSCPSYWTISDVIAHITCVDPALGLQADVFLKHVSHMNYFFSFYVIMTHTHS